MSFQRRFALVFTLFATMSTVALARYKLLSNPGEEMTKQAEAFIASLSEEQKKITLLEYSAPERLDWHFIPKPTRKGLQLREMNDSQKKSTHALLRSALSSGGYDKAVKIMELETLLAELEKNKKGGNIRDSLRYYVTIFGKPSAAGTWGLSIEGHHLSFNFVIRDNRVVSSTPTFYATNPAVVKSDVLPSIKPGLRVLADEETLAFELVKSLSPEQLQAARIAEKAPAEIRGAGEAQPPQTAPEGISADKLNESQVALLKKLTAVYAANVPEEVAVERLAAIEKADWKTVHFAWAGSVEPGVGHYYRVQGPTFLIEFVNVQPDAAGNPANHIHCVWRNMSGDFGLSAAK